MVLHDALDFGQCHLALGVPMSGRFAHVADIDALRAMPWSAAEPLRVVTGYHNIARKFFAAAGFEHIVLLSADGALEAAPAMGERAAGFLGAAAAAEMRPFMRACSDALTLFEPAASAAGLRAARPPAALTHPLAHPCTRSPSTPSLPQPQPPP